MHNNIEKWLETPKDILINDIINSVAKRPNISEDYKDFFAKSFKEFSKTFSTQELKDIQEKYSSIDDEQLKKDIEFDMEFASMQSSLNSINAENQANEKKALKKAGDKQAQIDSESADKLIENI